MILWVSEWVSVFGLTAYLSPMATSLPAYQLNSISESSSPVSNFDSIVSSSLTHILVSPCEGNMKVNLGGANEAMKKG